MTTDPFTQSTGGNSYDTGEAESMGCMFLVLGAIALFFGGVAVGHWCW